jgi:hypothetical protein
MNNTTCKHDWVGDDHCPYCENDTLKARIIELESKVGDLEEGCVALAVSPARPLSIPKLEEAKVIAEKAADREYVHGPRDGSGEAQYVVDGRFSAAELEALAVCLRAGVTL